MKNIWKSGEAGAVLLVLLTVMVYLPTLRGGFVFDDPWLITGNPMVKADDGLYRCWFSAEARPYYPLTWSLWWLEWRLWGANPMGYHAVNVLLHAVNAVLVWAILRRLKIPGAWLAAAVFAIHPVNVATVAWISEQKNTLSMLFFALAILLYLQFDEEDRPSEGPSVSAQDRRLSHRKSRWQWYSLSLVAFLFALLSKTAVVMLPVVLLGCAWWRRGRVRKQDWLCSLPFFVASMVLAVVIIVQHRQDLGESVVRTGGFAARLAGAGWVPWFYLSKALWPVDLTVIYPKWEVDASRWISYVPDAIGVAVFALLWRTRKSWGRPLLFGLGYFVVMLFPVSGFFDQYFYHYSFVADHWQYYSIIGVIALAVAAGERVVSRRRERSGLTRMPVPLGAGLAGMVLLVVLGVASWGRGAVYANEEILWGDNATKNPGAAMVYYNWATALEQAGKLNDAIDRYEQTLKLKPDMALAHNNLGALLSQSGKLDEAIGHYEEALRIRPDYSKAHCNLALALLRTGKRQAAIEHYKQAIRLKPDYVEAGNNLAWLLATLAPAEGGDPNQAVILSQRACEITGYRMAEYLDTLAVAYAATGRFSEAIATAGRAVGLAYAARQPRLAREIDARLQMYRRGRAYLPPVDATELRGPH
jgi:protein O-mannosyl-transferase